MAGPAVLVREQVIALQEAMQTIEELLGEDSPRLHSAQHDVVGRSMPDFVFSMVVGELTRVVARQAERIDELEKAVAKPAKAKS
jgi:hypothetical protein